MEIIDFNSGAARKKEQRETDTKNRLPTGSFQFTCPECNTKHYFSGNNVIFRLIEFYCSSCGLLNKVKNPGLK